MDILKILCKIENMVNTNMYDIYVDNKIVVSAKSMLSLKKKIKEDFYNPTKDIECNIMRYSLDPNYKYPLYISYTAYRITPKLQLFPSDNNEKFGMYSVSYTKEELLKYGFELEHIQKILYVCNNDLIKFKLIGATPITKVLKLTS